MRHSYPRLILPAFATVAFSLAPHAWSQEVRLDLTPDMVVNEADVGDPNGLVDEQRSIIGPPVGKPDKIWEINSKYGKQFPFSAYLDLGAEKNIASLWLFDTHSKGDVVISAGEPGKWREIATYDCGSYMKWAQVQLDVTTRYLRLTRMTPGAQFTEIAVYEYTPEAHQTMLDRRAAEAKRKADQEAALKRAREEALKRPLVDLPPYGKLSLVDEIDCAGGGQDHGFAESASGASEVRTVLGQQCRVLTPAAESATWFGYRIGRMKLLRPGAAYVLAVDYPEDAPRSMIVLNTGNETSRGFHTGATLGDAFHAKYVNNLAESLDVPLSGKWEQWTLLIRLHDRFPERGLVRGNGQRPLTPEDGFDVTIAQFSARNVPMSQGAAVSRIRLFEVIDPEKLVEPLRLPPEGLPRRHLFWREEMADGILGAKSDKPEERGLDERLDWYRNKADLMAFLGMNTFTKDLLEFGACQHWDSSEYGGHEWVYFDPVTKDLWGQVVELMGKRGFTVLPYYEYSGSKGQKGLGPQRRCRPLTRKDAYTHISWVESANADVTDPDTYDDFRKMLDLTVLRHRNKAQFVGAWIRTRSQLPISFSDATIKRYADEENLGEAIAREQLIADRELYNNYIAWWQRKRREFFAAMRDHLRGSGIDDAVLLYTGCPGEPGVSFNSWEPHMVTDSPDAWEPVLSRPEHLTGKKEVIQAITVDDVVKQGLYLDGLTSPGLNWGSWEVHHARPADDPGNYREMDGVLLTHAINRLYTVASPRTFDAYRTTTGLAVVRHYTLNENMMFDKNDKDILGYFVADIERAGPYCMMAEAVAVANGDPTMIGYLVGCNFGRGFPLYVRRFNANYLALPALPSQVVENACDTPSVVVREIRTERQGTWFAVVNTSMHAVENARIRLPDYSDISEVVSGRSLPAANGAFTVGLSPYELRTWHANRQGN